MTMTTYSLPSSVLPVSNTMTLPYNIYSNQMVCFSNNTCNGDPAVEFYNDIYDGRFYKYLKEDNKTPCVTALGRIFDWVIGNEAPYKKNALDVKNKIEYKGKQKDLSVGFFSPISQNTIKNVQTRIREIDMTLYPSVKTILGEVRTFTYSTLAGCCDFLDTVQLGEYDSEVESFAKEIVKPVVEECFLEIEKYHFELNNELLKLSLVDKLKKMQQYPKFNEFEEDRDIEIIKKLEKVITTGNFTLYKLNDTDNRYYGGRIDVDKESFLKATKIMEEAGYKQEGDRVGSSFDAEGHVTTIHPKEIAENYEHILKAHHDFVSLNPSTSLTPISIQYGYPPFGRLAKAVVIKVEAPAVETYRQACALGKLFPTSHVSIFTKEIQPLSELKEKRITFFQFIDKDTPYLRKMSEIFKKSKISRI